MSTLKVNSIQSFTPSEPVKLDDTVHFTVEISGGLVPNADDSFDLGSLTKKWKDLYIDGRALVDKVETNHIAPSSFSVGISSSLIVSGNITPNADDQFDLGSNANQWRDLYIDGTAYIDSASVDSGSFTSELKVTGPRVDFTNLPTADPGVSGRLYTQLGSQLPFTGSTAELNAISASKFVLVSA